MKKIILFIINAATALQASSQVVIQQGVQLRTAGNVNLVFNNLNVSNNASQSDLSGASVVVSGSTNVQLAGSGNWHVRSLIIDIQGMTFLGSPFTISDSIQLKQGSLNLNGRSVTFLPAAVLKGENENNRIIGPNGGEIIITLPLQSPSNVNPGNLGAIITSSQDLGNVTIRRGHVQRMPANTGGSILRYYQIVPANNQSLNATLRFNYLDAELNNIPENNLQLFSSDNGNVWRLEGPSARSTALNYVERTGLQSLQLHTLSPSAPLPLLWGNIKANCEGDRITVQWETLQEQNTDHFTVQRSQDGLLWNDVATIKAKGNTNATSFYSITDGSILLSGKLLYRIQATDKDGSKNASTIVTAQSCGGAISMKLWPVPARNKATLSIAATRASGATIKLFGSDGRLWQQFRTELREGNNQFELLVQNLAAGNYFLQVQVDAGDTRTVSFSKQ